MSSSAALGWPRRGIRRSRSGLPRPLAEPRAKRRTEGYVHRTPEALTELILQIDQVEQAEGSIPRNVDQQVDVAFRPRLAAGHRAEQA
jgi:hypothetical protein